MLICSYMGKTKELYFRNYVQREEDILRAPYNPELEFYAAIREGDMDKLNELLLIPLHTKEGLGKLSDDPLQNIKYHFTVTAALSARNCIAGGMNVSTAYNISDYYIKKADRARDLETVSALHNVMCLDYCRRMKALRKEKICSLHIAKSIDYIYDHLNARLTIEKLSEVSGLTPSYFSRLFKKETGMTVSTYINTCRIRTAQNMLVHSEYPPSTISSALAFPSQSYFTEVFKKVTGLTPTQYREEYFRQI